LNSDARKAVGRVFFLKKRMTVEGGENRLRFDREKEKIKQRTEKIKRGGVEGSIAVENSCKKLKKGHSD